MMMLFVTADAVECSQILLLGVVQHHCWVWFNITAGCGSTSLMDVISGQKFSQAET